MAQNKLVTNNATMIIQPNGDLLIKPRRLRSMMGFVLVLPIAVGTIFFLINGFSEGGSFSSLTWAIVLGVLGFFLARSSWRDVRKPDLMIEKTAQRVNRPGGQDPQSWAFSTFIGVTSVVSGSLGRQGLQDAERSQIFQIGLTFHDGKLMSLVETGYKKRDKAISMIAEITGLEILSAK